MALDVGAQAAVGGLCRTAERPDRRGALQPTMDKRLVRMSKLLSLVLRHEPEAIGLALDPAGWASVPELIRSANQAGHRLTPELLREVVAKNDKQRFTFSADGLRIRAAQGHSLPVDLGLAPLIRTSGLCHPA